MELASVPFATFIANKNLNGNAANYSFVLRGYVRHWLGEVWEEFDRIKLKDIIVNGGTNTTRPRPQVVAKADATRKSE